MPVSRPEPVMIAVLPERERVSGRRDIFLSSTEGWNKFISRNRVVDIRNWEMKMMIFDLAIVDEVDIVVNFISASPAFKSRP